MGLADIVLRWLAKVLSQFNHTILKASRKEV
jgi:hypothetical protein